jgi:hypothetical protein
MFSPFDAIEIDFSKRPGPRARNGAVRKNASAIEMGQWNSDELVVRRNELGCAIPGWSRAMCVAISARYASL